MQLCPRCQEPNSLEATFCNRCGSHLRGADNPLIDRIIGKYRLREKIGGGGFGSVYRAEHIDLANPFAVKILHPHFAGNPLMVERFKREARLLAGLRHENIVQVIDFGHMPGLGSYLIMEWIEGKTFQWHIQRFGIPPRHVLLQIFEQLLGALDLAHRQGIVHRDLKPENLMLIEGVGDRRTLKILDYGVARILSQRDENAPALTESGLAVGTPRYMSPEQARGDLEDIDGRTDIYAAGVLLVELLTGRTLYGGTTNEILIQQIEARAPSLQELAPHMYVTPRLQAVVDRALAKDKNMRFPTARAFSESLLPLLLEESGFTAGTGISVALSAIRQGVRVDPSIAAPVQQAPRPVTRQGSSPDSTRVLTAPTAPEERPQHTAERYNGEKLSSQDSAWLDEEETSTPPPPQRNWLWGTVGLFGGLAATLLVFLLGTSGKQDTKKHTALPAPPAPYRTFGQDPIQVLPQERPIHVPEPTPEVRPTPQPQLRPQPRKHLVVPKAPQRRAPKHRHPRKHKQVRRTPPRTIVQRPNPPVVTASKRFSLRLQVTPKGAEILVDGVRKGYTQTKLQAAEGQSLRILIRKEGYLSQEILWKAKRNEKRKVHLAENIF
ncbi:MAG: protein kinase [Myxococcales bacterium]|nr:protein kinase [Myxococcales bacterium]